MAKCNSKIVDLLGRIISLIVLSYRLSFQVFVPGFEAAFSYDRRACISAFA